MKKLLFGFVLLGISSLTMAMPYVCELRIDNELYLYYNDNGHGRGMYRTCPEGVLIWVYAFNRDGSLEKLPSKAFDSGNALCEDTKTAVETGQKRLQALKDRGVCL